MTTDHIIENLRHIKHLRQEAIAAQERVNEALEPGIVAALKGGVSPTTVAAESGVSDSYVRQLRRKHNLPADPRYAHLQPPLRVKTEPKAAN